jgi:hypothetical protein
LLPCPAALLLLLLMLLPLLPLLLLLLRAVSWRMSARRCCVLLSWTRRQLLTWQVGTCHCAVLSPAHYRVFVTPGHTYVNVQGMWFISHGL